MSIPALRSAAMTSGSSVAGPSVQTILALRESQLAVEDFERIFMALVYRLLLLRKRKVKGEQPRRLKESSPVRCKGTE
jgi:hypothetical protein